MALFSYPAKKSVAAKALLFAWLVLVLCLKSLAAPQPDSLRNLIRQSPNDTLRLEALLALADRYMSSKTDSAELLLAEAKAMMGQHRFYDRFPRYYHLMAQYFTKKGEYPRAQKQLVQAARIADSLGLLQEQFNASAMQAVLLARMGNYRKAMALNKSLLSLVRQINTPENYVKLYTNLAINYIYAGIPDTAALYFRQAYGHTHPNTFRRAAVAVNMAFLHYNLKQYDKAIRFANEAAAIARKLGYDELYLEALTNLANVYYETGRYDTSIQYSQKVKEIARKEGLRLQLDNAYGNLSLAYEGKGDYKTALAYHKKYLALHDSLFNEKMSKQINKLEIEYETEKKDRELEARQEKIRTRNRELAASVSGFVLLLAFALVVSVLYKKRNRAYLALVQKHLDWLEAEQKAGKGEAGSVKYSSSALSDEKKVDLQQKLEQAIRHDKLFLQPDLTLGKLSQHLGVNSKYLSQVIHESFQTDFSGFVNRARVNEASRLMADPAYAHISFEGIAEMVGFGSKSTFNKAFKRFTGVTPSFYLSAAKTLTKPDSDKG